MDEPERPPLEERLAELFRSIVGIEQEFTARELAEKTGMDLDLGLTVWRAFGMPEPDLDTSAFDATDVESMRGIQATMDLGVPKEDVIAIARVFGQVFSRLAEVEQRMYNRQFIEPMVREGVGVEEIAAQLRPISTVMLPLVEQVIVNAHRHALDTAIRQVVVSATESTTEALSVCMVDLVDYSGLSSRIDANELSEVVTRFEGVAVEQCAQAGIRLAKMIGDAAFFVSPNPEAIWTTASAVVEAVEADDLLPQARAGLDHGQVLPMEGDYFGHPVNVAARLVSIADPATILASRAFSQVLPPDSVVREPQGTRELKGVGMVEVFQLQTR
ncbi:MAG: adenylate/guanylate cyclase domain-containing protein [Actinomycetota bacterium]|nr:adenylate/guanylate cyclase domain-containing protein [Actinomycetota bacterium]